MVAEECADGGVAEEGVERKEGGERAVGQAGRWSGRAVERWSGGVVMWLCRWGQQAVAGRAKLEGRDGEGRLVGSIIHVSV